jgi:hypothetical protein
VIRVLRLLLFALGVGVLGSAAFAWPAAANDIEIACALTARMDTSGMDLVGPHEVFYVPPQNPVTGGTGQTGTYTLSAGESLDGSMLHCTGWSRTTGATGALQVQMKSSGTFENFLCGTGTATSALGQTTVFAVSSVGVPSLAADVVNALIGSGHSMLFVGDSGTFRWTGAIHSVPGNTSGIDGAVKVDALAGGCGSFPVTGTLTGEFSGSS